jgi:acyl-coenzyme A thioesterase PaaI-like protein
LTSEATRTKPGEQTRAIVKPPRPAIETPTGRFEFAAHNCFGCGSLNAQGLGLVVHVEPGRAWIESSLDRRFEGWQGVIHGGILCTILDEVMAWALVGEDNWGVTARMAVEFRRPVEVGAPIRAEGWITRARRRIVDTAGQIVDPASGSVLATATGVYLAADSARKQDLRARYAFRAVEAGPS